MSERSLSELDFRKLPHGMITGHGHVALYHVVPQGYLPPGEFVERHGSKLLVSEDVRTTPSSNTRGRVPSQADRMHAFLEQEAGADIKPEMSQAELPLSQAEIDAWLKNTPAEGC